METVLRANDIEAASFDASFQQNVAGLDVSKTKDFANGEMSDLMINAKTKPGKELIAPLPSNRGLLSKRANEYEETLTPHNENVQKQIKDRDNELSW